MLKIPTLKELLDAGVHFGHQVRRGHPRMKPYIYGVKEGVHILDLTKIEPILKTVADKLYEFGKEGKVLLLVGTKKQARAIIEDAAGGTGSPFFTLRWVGGFLTNFDEVLKNIRKLKDLKEMGEKGELTRYTKKERLLISRKIDNLDKDYKGVVNLEILPDGIFVADAQSDAIAIREANRVGIKVFAIADTNADPTKIDYFVPGNDDAIKSIRILVDCLIGAYNKGRKEAGEIKAGKVKNESADVSGQEVLDKELVEEVLVAEEEMEKKAVEDSERKV